MHPSTTILLSLMTTMSVAVSSPTMAQEPAGRGDGLGLRPVVSQAADGQTEGVVTLTGPSVWVSTTVPVPARLQSDAGGLLHGRPVAPSFAALRPFLRPGHEVIVVDDAGNETRGRVSSISDSALVLVRRRLFHAETWTASEGSVERIKIVDSDIDGLLLGLAAGVGGMAISARIAHHESAGAPSQVRLPIWGLWMLMAPVGELIDGARNGVVYASAPRAPRVTFAPALGHGRAGLVGQISF